MKETHFGPETRVKSVPDLLNTKPTNLWPGKPINPWAESQQIPEKKIKQFLSIKSSQSEFAQAQGDQNLTSSLTEKSLLKNYAPKKAYISPSACSLGSCPLPPWQRQSHRILRSGFSIDQLQFFPLYMTQIDFKYPHTLPFASHQGTLQTFGWDMGFPHLSQLFCSVLMICLHLPIPLL